jgi:hypothetical protein
MPSAMARSDQLLLSRTFTPLRNVNASPGPPHKSEHMSASPTTNIHTHTHILLTISLTSTRASRRPYPNASVSTTLLPRPHASLQPCPTHARSAIDCKTPPLSSHPVSLPTPISERVRLHRNVPAPAGHEECPPDETDTTSDCAAGREILELSSPKLLCRIVDALGRAYGF